jgi:RimJ/RimL family protein N-acetyltransferase
VIRQAEPSDLPALAELARRTWADAFGSPRLAGARRSFLTVWERNETALRLYESFGFRRVGTTRFAIGAEQVEDLVLVLDR